MPSSHSHMRSAARMLAGHDDPHVKAEYEYLHKRDDDLSVKAGAVLAFGGLLIAAGLVLLAAEPGTSLHAPPGGVVALIGGASVAVLFIGAGLSLAAIAMTRTYDLSHAEAIVARYDRSVRRKEALWRASCLFTILGALAAALAYVVLVAETVMRMMA